MNTAKWRRHGITREKRRRGTGVRKGRRDCTRKGHEQQEGSTAKAMERRRADEGGMFDITGLHGKAADTPRNRRTGKTIRRTDFSNRRIDSSGRRDGGTGGRERKGRVSRTRIIYAERRYDKKRLQKEIYVYARRLAGYLYTRTHNIYVDYIPDKTDVTLSQRLCH